MGGFIAAILITGSGYVAFRLYRILRSGAAYDDETRETALVSEQPLRYWFHVAVEVIMISVCLGLAALYWGK